MNMETIKAIVSALVIIIVNVGISCGIDIDGDMLTNVMCAIVLIGVTFAGIWKNHNFTKAAQKGQEVVDYIKKK